MSNRRRATAPTDRKPSRLEQVIEEARLLDLRRQAQISQQVQIIDRLLDGASYDDVFQAKVEELAATKVELDEVRRELEELRRGSP